jgi:CRP-like cAMP-binding protein
MAFQQVKNFYFQLVPELTEDIWKEIEERSTIHHLKKGEFYITTGQQEKYVSFVNKGGFRYFVIADTKELTCDFTFENNYISDYEGFLKQEPARINIQALEDSELVKLHYDDVQSCYERIPQLQKFGRLIAENFLLDILKRSNSLLFSSPEDRYNQLVEDNPKLLQRVPQYMIASFIGVTPEALSRIRKRQVYALI